MKTVFRSVLGYYKELDVYKDGIVYERYRFMMADGGVKFDDFKPSDMTGDHATLMGLGYIELKIEPPRLATLRCNAKLNL